MGQYFGDFIGAEKVHKANVERYMNAQRPHLKQLRVMADKEGYFMVQLRTINDCESILGGGTYLMARKLVVVKQ